MKKLTIILLSIVLSLLGTASLAAQESVIGQGLSVSPRQLTVAAMRDQRETRVLLIRADEPVTNLRIVPLDLSGPAGDTILPANAIGVELPAANIPSGGLLTVPVTFDLAGAPSGQFTGELLITYGDQSFSVPVNVAVKDPPWFALAALVVGVGLGVGVSTYRAQGRPRDEVLVRLGQIRTQMKADAELQQVGVPFYNRIDAHLVDVEVALEAQQWEKAQQAVLEAENLWVRWRRGRPDWLVQLKYYSALNVRLDELGTEIARDVLYVNEIRESARNAYRRMPNHDEPDQFRDDLEKLVGQINDFIALYQHINALESIPTGSTMARMLKQRLYALAPTNDTGFQSLKSEVQVTYGKAQIAQVEEKVNQLASMSAQLPETEALQWQPKVAAWQAQVEKLDPANPDVDLTVESEIDAALRQVEALKAQVTRGEEALPSPKEVYVHSSYSVSGDTQQAKGQITSPPDISVKSSPLKIANAGLRLRWFTWLTYAVAVVFLALAGFVELYGGRIDFGANGIGDYFTLLVWGFGAEATRASITEMVQGWRISAGR